jgi:hypothetical protein
MSNAVSDSIRKQMEAEQETKDCPNQGCTGYAEKCEKCLATIHTEAASKGA